MWDDSQGEYDDTSMQPIALGCCREQSRQGVAKVYNTWRPGPLKPMSHEDSR